MEEFVQYKDTPKKVLDFYYLNRKGYINRYMLTC